MMRPLITSLHQPTPTAVPLSYFRKWSEEPLQEELPHVSAHYGRSALWVIFPPAHSSIS